LQDFAYIKLDIPHKRDFQDERSHKIIIDIVSFFPQINSFVFVELFYGGIIEHSKIHHTINMLLEGLLINFFKIL
jgi:hypothetical protein